MLDPAEQSRRDMLDALEQLKGGFGAFAERYWKRRAARVAARVQATDGDAAGTTPTTTPGTTLTDRLPRRD
jgi:hypothetical protein